MPLSFRRKRVLSGAMADQQTHNFVKTLFRLRSNDITSQRCRNHVFKTLAVYLGDVSYCIGKRDPVSTLKHTEWS